MAPANNLTLFKVGVGMHSRTPPLFSETHHYPLSIYLKVYFYPTAIVFLIAVLAKVNISDQSKSAMKPPWL